MDGAEGTVPRGSPRRARGALGLLAFVLLVGGAGGGLLGYVRWCEGASGERRPVTLTVPEGASGAEVVDLLHERGVLRCGGAVGRYLLAQAGAAEAIRAGEHELTTNMSFDEALAVLTAPPPPAPTVRLTIPEGFRLTQIAARVEQVLGIPARRFLALAESGRFALPPYLPRGKSTVEGFLFPETYEFLRDGTRAGEVIRRLLGQFREEVAGLPWGNADRLGLTPYQVVVVASMVEEEAKLPRERPLIAAVILNRLARGMPLGIDATVAYIDPDPSDGLTASDLEIQSPYNTRLAPGLPPTPIASPGLDSIVAALRPAHVDFLYYVLCGADGHHEFSARYEEFLADKARCLG
ncbi:MAG TPA: endolytic transglycosylase MltG [Actinomycetota bacterium]|nr:endolytic transglycosylase MltG [Actinomycetota bacterium]